MADELTVTQATEGFEAQGYTAQFAALEGAMVRCFACRTDNSAAAFELDALKRTEGASDPDDMVANVAAICPNCKAKGVLTLKFGPTATLEEAQVLSLLDDDRNPPTGGTA